MNTQFLTLKQPYHFSKDLCSTEIHVIDIFEENPQNTYFYLQACQVS